MSRGLEGERVGAVRACAQADVEDDRRAEGGEAELGGDARRRVEVEEAEAAHFAAAAAGRDLDRADLGFVGAALAREAGFEGRDARGVEVEPSVQLARADGVEDQARRQLDAEVAQVAVGEADAGLVLEFAAVLRPRSRFSW